MVNKDKSADNNNNLSSTESLDIYQKQLRRLAAELSLTEARERREIASDLHDHIGQALAYAYQKVSMLQGNSIFSGMEDDFSEVLSILDQTIRYTRNLTVEISPPVLYELPFLDALHWLSEHSAKKYKQKIKVTCNGEQKKIADDVRSFIFKSIQELIRNVYKHAQTEKIEINLTYFPEHFTIKVIDKGIGMDVEKYSAMQSYTDCFGLFSIKERLSYIGGSLHIESFPAKGTTVKIDAPYHIGEESADD